MLFIILTRIAQSLTANLQLRPHSAYLNSHIPVPVLLLPTLHGQVPTHYILLRAPIPKPTFKLAFWTSLDCSRLFHDLKPCTFRVQMFSLNLNPIRTDDILTGHSLQDTHSIFFAYF
ncbi:hypothetical protein RvY_17514 [Ramazzottius varieornatus]|uniref:Uncharacterized protein n=1 Tax=Ramazzottius varieornatus TaxID=947166 RepID=A0A1D1W2D3_RAMVA|nr:hypothetical protein RvY_17514 [Ramazzottius varieornatus]